MDRPDHNSHSGFSAPRPHAGFSLVEVLVTLLIMGLGLSGWALLLALGFSVQHDAYARTQATLLASTLMERIRVRQLPSNDPTLANYEKAYSVQERGSCSATDIHANNDRICWYQAVSEFLPNGTGRISVSEERILIETFWFDGTAFNDARVNSRAKCEDPAGANRIWSDNPEISWVPPDAAPRPATCLQVQRWTLPL